MTDWLAAVPPWRLIVVASLVPLLLVPGVIARLVRLYTPSIELTLRSQNGDVRAIDRRWLYPIAGASAAAIYLALAALGRAASSGTSSGVRNVISLSLLPVSLLIFYLAIRRHR